MDILDEIRSKMDKAVENLKTNLNTLNQQLKDYLSQDETVLNGPFISITKPYEKEEVIATMEALLK